jgi:hypothetical protein
MAQATDFTLSNQAFGSFRTELNSVLSAVNSCQSGTTTPPSAVAGTIWLDTTSATTPTLKYYDGADNISLATIDHVGNTVNWLDSTVSITGLTTTATGTVLTLNDTNLNSTVSIRIPTSKGIDDDSGNEFLKFTKTASAVNEFTIINSATGNAPEIQATGGDTNIDLKITPKGSGKINLDGIKFPNADGSANQALVTDGSGSLSFATIATFNTPLALVGNATAGSEIRLPEDTDNGSNYVALKAPDTIASNLTLTLPSADGTANQVLKTNGSGVLSFATPSAGFNGGTTTSSAVDITLTSASTQVQSVSMTASNKSVILPDATTLTTKGFPIFVIVNTGLFTFYVKNNSGYILATIAPTISVEFTLIDNTTSDGIFANDSIAFNLVSLPFVSVEATTGLSTNYFASEWETGVSIEKISTSSFFVSYHKGTSNRDVYGRVISFSGTTITVNSETILYNGSSSASQGASVCLTSSTTGILLVARASNCVAIPFSLSGSTITVGTTSATFSIASSVNMPFAKPIKVTSTLIAFGERSATSTFKLRTIQYNGASAPTIGTISSTSITMANDEVAPPISRISDTELFMAYGRVGGTDVRIITISGTSAPVYNTANTTSTQETATSNYGHFINQIDSTNFIVWGYLGSVKYTVSGTTVTHVSDKTFAFYNDIDIAYYNMVNAPFNGGDYVVTNRYSSSGYFLLKKDGNHMAIKTPAILFDKSVFQGGLSTASKIVALDTNTLAVVTNNGGSGSTLLTTIIKYVGA